MSDIVEDLRLLASGAQWVDSDTAATLENAAAEIERLRAASAWRPIHTAPRDGTPLLLWCVHAYAPYSPDPAAEGWEAAVVGHWADFNGGGWTWHGLAGRMTHWRPIPPAPAHEAARDG